MFILGRGNFNAIVLESSLWVTRITGNIFSKYSDRHISKFKFHFPSIVQAIVYHVNIWFNFFLVGVGICLCIFQSVYAYATHIKPSEFEGSVYI